MGSEERGAMPIAVIGLGCRFPGDVTNSEKLWDMLLKKKSARSQVPADRYDVDAFYHPDGDRYGTTNNRGGHYLTEDIALFDAPFFSISPAEAMAMDPMQRLLLEVTYEALENSGTSISRVSGTNTSCYVGCFTKDYEEMQRRDIELAPKYQSTGASQTMLSNRLSYFFDLKGPSVSLDTACSSGLVAVHLACQSLRSGESSMAIAGGSNLILSPDIQIEMSDMHFLSPDSISYTFDDRANGYARGEGVGAVILKPLNLALRDNDPIRAVIRATASSSDGRTPGITMPSKEAQINLIRSAYKSAGCDVSETGYFEAHGTGTAAGDPIETGTIAEVFAEQRPLTADGIPIPLAIGSVKTNMGHLEGASGIAGLIKAILSVEKGVIAPNIWFERGNPNIDFEKWRLKVPVDAMDWPLEGIRRASINSFGYGGTNAHVIIDDAQHYLQRFCRSNGRSRTDSGFVSPVSDVPYDSATRPRIFLLSANDERSLKTSEESLADHLRSLSLFNEEEYLDNLTYTLNERRSRLPYTSAIVASTLSELQSRLIGLAPIQKTQKPVSRLGFIFTGQGAQWWGMGRELLPHPVFKRSLQKCDHTIQSLGASWSLLDELLKDKATSRVNEAVFSQPLCTALQVALVDLLASWNIRPHSVVGHSSGEIAAAYATGALNLAAAMKVAYYRGMLSPKVKALGYDGRMMAVGLSHSQAEDELSSFGNDLGNIVVACINSPRSITLSGDAKAIEALQKTLDAKGIFARLLQVDTAYHSHHMKAIADEYLAYLKEAQVIPALTNGKATMFSSVTEKVVEQDSLGPDYWVSNLVGTVRFSGALSKLCISEQQDTVAVDVLVEIGPHALFKLPAREVIESTLGATSDVQYIPFLIRNKAADSCVLEAAAQLILKDYPVNLHTINFPTEPKHSLSVLTDLPQYRWNHTRRYWCESRLSRDYRFRRFARTDILGAPVYDWNPFEPRFRNFMRLREQPWLRDHVVQGDVLFPACGYICMAIEACRQMSVIAPSAFLPKGSTAALQYRLREVSIMRALVVPEADEGVETCFSMRCEAHNDDTASVRWHEFHIFSYTAEGGWAENCRGLISVSSDPISDDDLSADCVQDWENAQNSWDASIDPSDFYTRAQDLGLAYGPLFQGLNEIRVRKGSVHRATGVVQVTDTRKANPKEFEHDRLLHPATLDSFLQLALAALCGNSLTSLKGAMVPTFMEEISISADIAAQIGDRLNVCVDAELVGTRAAGGNIFALDPKTSKPVVLVDGFKFVAINGANETNEQPALPKHCYIPVWEPDVELIGKEALNLELQAAPRPDDRPKTVRELELLSYCFIDKALQKVGDDEVQSMLPHHQRFYRNLRKLQNDVTTKVHPQQTEEWQRLHTPEVTAKLDALIEHYRGHETAYDGKLLVRVGEALPLVFRQEVEPLALMTHENLLEDYYTTAVGMPNTYAQITRYVQMLTHKNPNLKFLEIGAGTGGATVPTVAGLYGKDSASVHPRLESYTYTDISSYFFQRAEEKFSGLAPFMKFKKLDVEQDPESQGFAPASYDVIVAANVLHATSDMHRTMTHARKLLRPGGKLVLLEMTNRLLAASVIFGTLPGWWNASEEWRTEGPLLTEAQWIDTLRATGFSGLEASSPDVTDPLEEGTRLMIATAVEPGTMPSNGLPTPPESLPITILCTDSPVKMNKLDMPLALKARLEKVGLQTRIKPLAKVTDQDINGAVCISFVEIEEPLLADLSPSAIKAIQSIAETSAGLVWVTRGATSPTGERPELAVFQGLARTLRTEQEHSPCITVDLDDSEKLDAARVADLLMNLYERQLRHPPMVNTIDSEFLEKRGILYVKRAVEDSASNTFLTGRTAPAALPPRIELLKQGERSLRLQRPHNQVHGPFIFKESKNQPTMKADCVEIEIQATRLHREDIHALFGEVSDETLGRECAGTITKVGSAVSHLSVGDSVSAWCTDAIATHVRIPASFAHKISSSLSITSAAILPLAYSTAYHSLVEVARIDSGETVLIHDAASAVGQAAIQIASILGAKIFVTASSEEETANLSMTYGIDKCRIFSSQDMSFVTALRRATGGCGVDVVLNTLSGEALQATFSCLAYFGRLVNLDSNSAQQNERLEMASFKRNVSFSSVDINLLYKRRPRQASKVFQAAMDFVEIHNLPGIAPTQVKSFSELEEAINLVKTAKDNTAVVLVPVADSNVVVAQAPPEPTILDANATYLLAGGLGGLGRSIAKWLSDHGARNLIFVSRSGAVSQEASSFVRSLEASGIRVAILKCDVSDALTLSNLLSDTLKTFPPIRGVIQGAMALNDSLFSNMAHKQWTSTILPKVHGSKNLHEATLSQPLDFFIVISSLHSFIGNPGQANYAAGCAYQVALATYRTRMGLPATAIDLGIVGDVGYVVEKKDAGKKLKVQNFKHISEVEMLALIELGIKEPMKGHLITGLDSDIDITNQTDGLPFFAKDPVLSHLDWLRPHLRAEQAEKSADSGATTMNLSLAAQIANSDSPQTTKEYILTALLKKLSRSLMMEASELDPAKPMSAYGTDSLVAVELKNWVQRETKAAVSVFDILQSSSIAALVDKIVDKISDRKEV